MLELPPLSTSILAPEGSSAGTKGASSGHSVWVGARAVVAWLGSETGTAPNARPLEAQQWLSLPCSDAALGLEPPVSLTAGLSRWPQLSLPWCGDTTQGSGASADAQRGLGHGLCLSGPRQRPGLFLMCCLRKHHTAALAPLRHHLGLSHLYVSAQPSPQCGAVS